MPSLVLTLDDIRRLVAEAVDGPPNQQKLNNVEGLVHQLLTKDPDNWMFLLWMAGILNRTGRFGVALALLARAGDLRGGGRADIHNNMGGIYRRLNLVDKAEAMFMLGLEEDPANPDILNNLATLYVNEGSASKGLEFINRALEINPGKPHPHWNGALMHLEQEDFAKGFDEYVWGHVTMDRPAKRYVDSRGRDVHWWYGQKVGTLLVFGEQGVGDEVMFLSMVPDILLFCDRLILDIHPRLMSVVKRTYRNDPRVIIYGTRKEWDIVPEWGSRYEIDAKASLGTCAKYLRYDKSLFPGTGWIEPNEELTQEAKWLIPGDGPLIGVSWVGGVLSTRKDLRAIPLSGLMPVFSSVQNARFMSLQYTAHGGECEELEKNTGIQVKHFPDWTETQYRQYYDVFNSDGVRIARYGEKEPAKQAMLGMQGARLELIPGPAFDLDRLMSMINACDAIVTVNQSNVWFGGALGKPVFTLTPSKAAWRYGKHGRSDTIWFKSVRQYWQEGDDWAPTVERLAADLKEFVNG